jgi:hypothetical protein
MKNKILFISALLLATVSISMANSRSDAENQCVSVCSDQRSVCSDACYNENGDDMKNDMTYIAINQCRDKCNPISDKCKEACVPAKE